MSQDASAGRLYVSVVADLTGFGASLRQKVEAAAARVRANINVQVDAAKAQAELDKTAAKARTAQIAVDVNDAKAKAVLDALAAKKRISEITVQARTDKAEQDLAILAARRRSAEIKADLDDSAAKAKLDNLAARNQRITIQAEVDAAKAEAQLAILTARRRSAEIKADVDDAKAKAELDRLANTRRTATIGVKMSGLSEAGTALMQFGKISTIAGGIGTLVVGVGSLAEGLVAVAAAAGQALGVLGAIPAAIGGALQTVGTLALGFQGVSDAVKAVMQADAKSAASAGTTARARIQASQRVADAQRAAGVAQMQAARSVADAEVGLSDARVQAARRIADAQRSLADAQETAARRIRDAQESVVAAQQRAAEQIQSAEDDVAAAEQDLARTQVDARNAQEALTQAREDAVQRIADMTRQLKDAALTEEEASIAVDRARRRLEQTKTSETATPLDLREADLAYRQALQRLEDVKASNAELQKEYDKTTKAGVDGATEVVAAQQKVTDAQDAQRQAQQRLVDSQANLVKTQQKAAQDVARAQRDASETQQDALKAVANAQRDLQQTQTDSAKQIAKAQQDLSRAQQDAARQVADAQRGVIQAQQAAAEAAQGSSAALEKEGAAMANLSPAGQRFVRFIVSELLPRFKELRSAVQESLLPPIQRGVTAALPLLGTLQRGFVDTAKTIGTFVESAGRMAGTPLFRNDTAAIMASNNRALGSLGRAGLDVITIFRNLSVAAGPLVERIASYIERISHNLADLSTTARNNGNLTRFFQTAGDRAAQLISILGNVARALSGVFRAATGAGDSLLGSLDKVTKGWADLSNSTQGQNAMRQAFAAVEPIVRGVGQALMTLLDIIGQLSTQGGGPLRLFLGILNGILSGLDRFVRMPGGAAIVNSILVLAAAGGALSYVSGALLKIAGGAGRVSEVFSKMTAEGGLFSRLFVGGPWGLIIVGVAALAAGLIYAYFHWQKFHDVVDSTVRAIGRAAAWLWDSAIHPAFDAIAKFTTGTLIPALVFLWHGTAVPAMQGIGAAVTWLWVNVASPLLGALARLVRLVVGPTLLWLWKNVAVPAFTTIGQIISGVWAGIIRPALGLLNSFIRGVVAPTISWLWGNIVAPVFRAIGALIKTTVQAIVLILNGWTTVLHNYVGPALNWLWQTTDKAFRNMGSIVSGTWAGIKRIFDAMRGGVAAVGGSFSTAVDVIRRVWAGMQKAASDPVKFVIDTVYNNGLRNVWNSMAALVHLPELKKITLARGFATGGVIPGYAPGQDTVAASLSPGEGILVPEAVRGIAASMGTTAQNAIQAINAKFSSRVAGPPTPAADNHFQFGGLVGWLGDRAKDVGSWTTTGLRATGNALKNLTLGSLKKGIDLALAPIRTLVDQTLPKGIPFSDLLRAAVGKLLGGVSAQAKASDDATPAGGGGGGGAVGAVSGAPTNVSGNAAIVRDVAASMFGWVGAQWNALYHLIMGESGFKNTAQNPTSSAYGIFQFLNSTWGGVGGRKTSDPRLQAVYGLRYISQSYGTPANAWAKWSSRSPHWYDKGGIASGTGLMAKDTIEPERVLSPEQTRAFDRLVDAITRPTVILPRPQGVLTAQQVAGETTTVDREALRARLDRDDGLADQVRALADAVARIGSGVGAQINVSAGRESVHEIARAVAVELDWMARA